MTKMLLLFVSVLVGCASAEKLLAPPPPDLAPPSPNDPGAIGRSGSECGDIWNTKVCANYKRHCNRHAVKEKCARTCGRCPQEIQMRPNNCPNEFSPLCQRHGDPSSSRCGKPAIPLRYSFSQRIIGGRSSDYRSIPWQVAIYSVHVMDLWCGGVLIDRDFILTAAHCFKHSKHAGDYFVFLGKHRRALFQDPGEEQVKIKRLIVHPDFNPISYDNDIVLIQLETKVTYNTYIRPVCLPTPNMRVLDGREALVSGWGVTDVIKKTKSDVLLQTNVKIINSKECESWLGKNTERKYAVTDNMLCAGYPKGTKDSCQGDSGGPLVVQESNQHFLAGIVSWGLGCGEAEKPGIYVKVQNYVDWIADEILNSE